MHGRFTRPRPAAPEVNESQMSAAAHHFVSGHRGIKSPRQEANHSPSSIRRQASYSGNPFRIHQDRTRRDFDSACHLRIVELHAHCPAGFTQFLQQVPSHMPLNFIDPMGEGFVTTLRTNREIREFEWRYFLPGGLAERL